MKLLRILLTIFLISGFVLTTMATASPQKPGESLAAASGVAPRDSQVKASRSNRNMFVFPVDFSANDTTRSTTTTSTTSSTTTSTTSAPKPKPNSGQLSSTVEAQTANTGGNNGVVSLALAQVGKRYLYGATGPNAFDCSGLIYWVFNQAGIPVPRLTNTGYYSHYQHVSASDLEPGDVVIYPSHIGIYIGNGQMVHAAEPRNGVRRSSINAPGHPIGYARL